ncbi:MAG: alpha/beta hydrolase [Rhodothermales bacterium]|nr:alpha/beta hydrolase [Rhodothermales bacterium]
MAEASDTSTESFRGLRIDWYGPEAAPGIVVLHGWGSSSALMEGLALTLAHDFRVANVDLPGHGRAPVPEKALGVPEQATLVADLIRERFAAPVAVVGHSNGGRLGLFMASGSEMKSLVSALVLIAPSGVRPKRRPSYYLKKYTAQLLKAPFNLLPGRLRDFGLDWLRHSLVWKALGSSDYRRLDGVMRETFVKTVTHHLEDRLPSVTVPTLIFWGDRDRDISRDQIAVLESRIPDAGVVTLKGAGHYAHLDDPQTVQLAAAHFLRETLGVSSAT